MTKLMLMAFLSVMICPYSESRDEGEEPVLPPLHLNCTQAYLGRMFSTEEATTQLLKEAVETLVQVRDTLNEVNTKIRGSTDMKPDGAACQPPFTQVGELCLLLALQEQHTWVAARQFCAGYGADLAHFSDANTFAAVLGYVNTINFQRKNINIWIGGTDEAVEDTWLWVTGELMPRGPPFWGTADGYALQPNAGTSQNCAVLWKADYYYMHDLPCTHKCAPLCQK
ncbi:uncharacterized protein LOC119590402 [Penaeus monodon]|uniref:uncharacterized protein LOC119590402 n=1 Tax=Penaeus monodon TaxID=6687 RepID=UPI0018A74B89|nr:uncharacterized protein LOC119590402 [Penaeus monodon]